MKCREEQIFACLSSNATTEQLDVTWVDDTVLMTAVTSPDDIVPVAKSIAGIAFTQLRRVGFTPNCKRGKSQVMPVVIGRRAADVNADIFGDNKRAVLMLLMILATSRQLLSA